MYEVVKTESDSDDFVLKADRRHKSNAFICLEGQPIWVLINFGTTVNLTDWHTFEYINKLYKY